MKIVILESKQFANLVYNLLKSTHLVNLLSTLCEAKQPTELYMSWDMACEMFDITYRQLKAAERNELIRSYSLNGQNVYQAVDLIELKCKLDRSKYAKMINATMVDDGILQGAMQTPYDEND